MHQLEPLELTYVRTAFYIFKHFMKKNSTDELLKNHCITAPHGMGFNDIKSNMGVVRGFFEINHQKEAFLTKTHFFHRKKKCNLKTFKAVNFNDTLYLYSTKHGV